jgi:hypothetical protein
VDVPLLLEVRADDLFGDAGPPVAVQGGELLRRVLADVLHLQLDDLRLRGQVDEDEPVGVGMLVDGEGTGDEPGNGDGVEPSRGASSSARTWQSIRRAEVLRNRPQARRTREKRG